MAKKIIQQLVDDIDGSLLEDGDGETLLFSLDGISYEIDLSSANAGALREALAPYVGAGRRVSGARPGVAPTSRRSRGRAGSGNENSAIREWAESNGFSVAARGRIPENIVAAYRAAN